MSTAAPRGERRRRRPQLRLPAGWTYLRILAGLLFGLALIAGLAAPALVSLFGLRGPLVRDPSALNLFGNPTGPSASHPLGVDASGRDVASRILYGLRSLWLLSLAGTGFAALAGVGLAALAELNRWVACVISLILGGLRAFPPVLLGLGLALGLGPGVWQLIVTIALVVLSPARIGRPAGWRGAARWLWATGPWLVTMLANAAAVDVALTFLGDGPGGRGPQLGAMVARAGLGILAGVPAWWALLFPGLVAMLVIGAGAGLAGFGRPTTPALAPALALSELRWWPRTRAGYLADRVTVALGRAVCVLGLAALMFSSLAGSGAPGQGALSAVGSDLGATGSVLLGGVVVWGLMTLVQVRLGTRAHVRRRLVPDRLARLPALAVGAAPAGWLGFLALYLFSDSVGKLPVLPGAHTYVGLTQAPGRWAQSLLIPWLLLGLGLAAGTAPALGQAIIAQGRAGQQRVARAAGVPEARLARQRRRALVAPLFELIDRRLVSLAAITVLLESTFQIPGVGALAVGDFDHGRAATVSDIAVLAALAVLAVGLVLDVVRLLVDPQVIASPEAAAP